MELNSFQINGGEAARIPFGEERWTKEGDEEWRNTPPSERKPWAVFPPSACCVVCGADRGEYHDGPCQVEQCPVCGKQAVFCEHCRPVLKQLAPEYFGGVGSNV